MTTTDAPRETLHTDPAPASPRRVRRWAGLRQRLVLVFTLAVLPVVVALMVDATRERREVAAGSRQRLSMLVETAAREQALLLRSATRELSIWVRDPAIRGGTPAECETALLRLGRLTPELVFATRIDAQGRVTCGGSSPTAVGRDVSANPIFRTTLQSSDAVVGPYLRSTVLPEPLMPVNVRITDDSGRPTGVLSVGVRMRWLADVASRSDMPPQTVITLVDESGLVLARFPDGGYGGSVQPTGYTSLQLRLGRTGGLEDGISFDNVPRSIAFTRLPSPETQRVGVSVSIPLATMTAATDTSLRRRLGLLGAALGVSVLVAWFATTRLITRDVARVATAAERIGTGDFTARTGISGAAEEVQQLAEVIDSMAARLGMREERALRAQKLESIGRLAGGVAHDFNNLLTVIGGNVEEVRDSLPLASFERESLELALDATRRSGALTRQLLAFSRRDAVQSSQMSVPTVLEETAQLLRRTLGTAIRIEVRADAALVALADRGRLEQALLNLALNARDAMPTGGALTLTAVADVAGPPGDAAGGRWIRIDVRDTGTGMTPDVRARLFEPFFTTKPVGQGTGLGLAMVYATMEQLGGAVSVESALGAGTTFSLWLPAAAPADANAGGAGERDVTHVSRGAVNAVPGLPERQLTVLLVDDEAGVRAFVARVLRRDGYAVLEASDGAEALQLADRLLGGLEALVTDLTMPRLGGVELAQALRQRRPDLPVVLMTGFAGGAAPDSLLSTPRTVLLEKPFDAAALVAALARCRAES